MALNKLGKILLYCCAGTLCFAILLMLAVTISLDRVPHYQAQIKDWVHEQIGYHIAFARVSPAFRWYGPELNFDRLELRSKDDARVLARAAGGRIGVDLWELLRSGKLFAARIELDAPNIVITRTAPNEFALASEITLKGGDSSLPPIRLADLPAGTLAIRRGLVTVADWNAELPRLEMRDVSLDLRRGNGVLVFAVAARLPAELGGDINVNAAARGAGGLDGLLWTVLARARNLSLGGWGEALPDYLARLTSGTGSFEAAVRGRGPLLIRADLDFDATNVVTRLANQPAVKFDRIAGSLTMTHSGDQWTVLGRRLFAIADGRRDPQSEFDVSWRGDDAGLVALRANASYLRAETLLPLAGLLPQKDLRERLQEIEPTGEWLDMHVNLQRQSPAEPWRFDVRAQFRGVGFAPVDRAPGLRGLDGMIAGTESGGRVELTGRRAVFSWPFELPQAIDLAAFNTTLYWSRSPQELLIATPSIDIKNEDATVHGRVAWRQPADGSSPLLTVAASVADGNAADARRYLPRALLPPSALAWLNRAFVAGHLSHADVVLAGPVRHFPFRDGTGLFLARAHIDGMTLDYREGWPPAENLALLAEFRNEGLTVQLGKGSIGALTMDKGSARFVDFKAAELQLHATGSGDAGAVLEYLRATPLDALAGQAFSGVEARGPMHADVDLFLPFKAFDTRRTLVHAHLDGVSVNRVGSAITATELTGDADVDGAQVTHADVRGKFLGGAFQMQGRSPRGEPATRTQLVWNGTLAGDALRAALGLPAYVPISGTTDWHGVLRLAPEPARERSLRLTSSLSGLDLGLPAPLAKPAGRPLLATVDVLWPPGGGMRVRGSLGSVVRGAATLDSDANGLKLGRTVITFGTAPDTAASDGQIVSAGGAIGLLDLTGWLRLYRPEKNAKPLGSLLHAAKFEVGQIDFLGLSFMDVSLDLTASDGGWRIGAGGPNVAGSIMVPGGADAAAPWTLEFQRLKFAGAGGEAADPGLGNETDPADGAGAAAADAVTAGAAAPAGDANPRAVPALTFHAADLNWGERQFGDVRATLAKVDDGVRLDELVVAGGNFTITGKGEWRGKDAGTGRIEGTLASSDVSATLKQLGYIDVIQAKSGKLDFDLSWLGAPTPQALRDATGHVQIALDKGQITGLKPGAGRLVGLASVAALPRRLALDFSDLTDKGFAFDTARGSFDIHDGSAFTDDVLVKGPAAEIGLIGRVGLKKKDYDQTAVVTGNVSSSLPLAAFAGGPVIGGAVLVFTQVFKQPLKGLARGYYRITGGWDNPTVERIKSAGAAAATAEAPK
jgi:uncharacterized protein (TIGR02099 family)